MGHAGPPLQSIGLLIRARADRRLLAEFLGGTGHPVLAPEPCATDLEALHGASMVIVDEDAARECSQALLRLKERVKPVILPILVALPAAADGADWLRRGFDALLRMPLGKGDLLARLVVTVPKKLSKAEKEALEAYRRTSREQPREHLARSS